MTFYDGANVLGTAPINGAGSAEMSTSGLTPGGKSISATYSGDTNFLGASSAGSSVTVTRAATRIIVTPQKSYKMKKLDSVGLMAVIQPITPGGGVPTGIVTFELRKRNKETMLGTAALSAGSATIWVKPSRVQNQVVTIIYGGDEDYLSSTKTTPRLTQRLLKNQAATMLEKWLDAPYAAHRLAHPLRLKY
jgi:hypothetical protein